MSNYRRFYLSLGSNLGVREASLANALNLISKLGKDLTISSVYETSPVLDEPEDDHPSYLNMAASILSDLGPEQFHLRTMDIEKRLGRFRAASVVSRTIDIDITAVENIEGQFGSLILPHPRSAGRRFVVEPLVEIEPDLELEGTPVKELKKSLSADLSQELNIFLSSAELNQLMQEVAG